MKNIMPLLAGILVMAFAFTACQQVKPMDEATMKMKADSIAKSHMSAIADSMMKDCDANSTAWIKAKTDSIYNASMVH